MLSLVFTLATVVSSFADGQLPPIPDDRLNWYTCDTVPVNDPAGYTLRITREELSITKGYAELYVRGDDLGGPKLLKEWTIQSEDRSSIDDIHYLFKGDGFFFEHSLKMSTDDPTLDSEYAHLDAKLDGRGMLSTDMECVPL